MDCDRVWRLLFWTYVIVGGIAVAMIAVGTVGKLNGW